MNNLKHRCHHPVTWRDNVLRTIGIMSLVILGIGLLVTSIQYVTYNFAPWEIDQAAGRVMIIFCFTVPFLLFGALGLQHGDHNEM